MDGIGSLLPISDSLVSRQPGAQISPDNRTLDSMSAAGVGQEFESVFLSMLLKNMRSTVSEGGMFAGDESDTYGSMFDLFMSQHLAGTESLGIGQMIEELLTDNNPAKPVITNVNTDLP